MAKIGDSINTTLGNGVITSIDPGKWVKIQLLEENTPPLIMECRSWVRFSRNGGLREFEWTVYLNGMELKRFSTYTDDSYVDASIFVASVSNATGIPFETRNLER